MSIDDHGALACGWLQVGARGFAICKRCRDAIVEDERLAGIRMIVRES